MPVRRYVDVNARFSDGRIYPTGVIWEDGVEYPVDRVLDIRRAAGRDGSFGLRYTVLFGLRRRYLYLEDGNRWFVEAER